MSTTRRQFLHTALAASAGAVLAAPGSAIEPIQRNGKTYVRLSIAAYSYRKYLDLKIKPKPPMTLDDFIDVAAGMDLPAVELTAYYFPETSPEYLSRLKGKCTRLGLDISGTAVGNSFTSPDAAKLKDQIASVKKWTEHSSLLGAKTMRIFAGNKDANDSEEKARERCVAAIQECCDHAAKFGVILALENHGGIVEGIDQMLAVVKAVKHDWFGVNWDSGNFHSDDPYADLAKLAPYAVTAQIKTEIKRKGKPAEEADLKRKIDMLKAVNYRGYVALEYEAAEEPKTAIPRYVETMKKLIG
ncbi:MAG: sugar phosphate isomerase/epimerase [Gemmataceae bacterium]|nr:sugar phosphate isomerase/epimerase [Gemmataceae bacterium]